MMKQRQHRFAILSLLMGGVAFGLSACATTRPTGTHETLVEREAVVTVTAMDVPNRLVTVRNAAGDLTTYYVDRSVTTFPQAKVGDQVRVRFTESMALQLKKPGEAGTGLSVSEEATRPQPGQPSAHSASEVKATVNIESVDKQGSLVTFTGPRGRRTVRILDPAMRDYVKKLRPGDNVDVTYKEALALSLDRVSGS